jgi:MoaA/NifB/PqqE/SkfB family radical SAM enzyme
MPLRVGLPDTFKVRLLRRLGSWGSKLSLDDIDRILGWASKVIPNRDVRCNAEKLHYALSTHDSARELVGKFFELAPSQRQRMIENFFVNWGVVGHSLRYQVLEEDGWLPPAFGVISPTMRCNLRCEGCYAFEYSRGSELTTEEFDSAISQCKDLGMYFFTISGGEPFVREDLFDIMGKHNDAFFQIYTNGTMIDDRAADRLLELGNATPAISVEGFEEETNARRGEGVYWQVLDAMERLKDRQLLFGISMTVTKYNHDVLKSDELFDFYVERGAKFAWLFQYIPIGREPNVDLMSTPEQRTELRHRVVKLRDEKPIFIGDFWNDGQHVGGCMAGGRGYFHITSNGNVEPCVFCHFAVGNIREKPLRELLSCDFFRAIRYEQPYRKNKNLYTPCMIIDNPEILRRLIREYGAKPSHAGAETIVEDAGIIRHLDAYAARLREIADPEWHEDHYDNPRSEWYREGERIERQWSLERPHLEEWYRKRHSDESDTADAREVTASVG